MSVLFAKSWAGVARASRALGSDAVRMLSARRALSFGRQPAANHPWIAEVPGPKSFLPEERVLTFLAANVAAGNIDGVARDWAHVPPSQQGKGLEIVLQVHTLAGFPRTINALIKIQELGLHPEGTKYFDEVHDLAVWNKQGVETLETVYGSVSEKMRRNFKKMHPLLECILTEHIYGRVLSRPLVDLRIRELCSLGIIAGQNLPLQLVSHLRGSVRCGATREEVMTVVEQTYLAWGTAALTKAQSIRDQHWAEWAGAECEIE